MIRENQVYVRIHYLQVKLKRHEQGQFRSAFIIINPMQKGDSYHLEVKSPSTWWDHNTAWWLDTILVWGGWNKKLEVVSLLLKVGTIECWRRDWLYRRGSELYESPINPIDLKGYTFVYYWSLNYTVLLRYWHGGIKVNVLLLKRGPISGGKLLYTYTVVSLSYGGTYQIDFNQRFLSKCNE